jgi:hypothetical protein
MYIKDGKPLADNGFSIGEGEGKITFPPLWLSRASESDLNRFGITRAPDPEPPPEPDPPSGPELTPLAEPIGD